jgi:hypothetical protein
MTDAAGANGDSNRRLLNRTGAAVAVLLVVILAVSLGLIMQIEIPEKNHDIALILITTVCNAVIGVTGYFFGSSSGTTRQGEIIATQADVIAARTKSPQVAVP